MEPQQKCDRSISHGMNPYRDMAVRKCCKMENSPTDRTNTKHRWFSLQDVYFSPVFVCAIFTQFDCYITNNSREFVSLHCFAVLSASPLFLCIFFTDLLQLKYIQRVRGQITKLFPYPI